MNEDAKDPRTVTLDAKDWLAVVDALAVDLPYTTRLLASIREQARVA